MPPKTPNMSLAEMSATIARLEAENAKLTASKSTHQSITLKVSEKAAVSVYGLGRFPVTLYGEQWAKLIAKGADILAFIEVNKARLSTKADSKARQEQAAAAGAVKPATTGAL